MANTNLGADSIFAYPPHLPPRAAIETAVETLVAVLNAMDGDPDVEQTGDENEPDFISPAKWGDGPGCPIADPGGCEHDGVEPDHDAEIETFSHYLDHPPELHIGKRPGWNIGPEGA